MKRSKFNLSNYKLATMDMGKLYPIGLSEVLPGDTFRHSTSALVRLSPMKAPVMHPLVVRIHHWFVPHRIVWSGWEDFITGGPDGNDTQKVPTITVSAAAAANELFDYFGANPVEGMTYSALPVGAFNKIYNEYYRDQDLAVERNEFDASIPKVAWEKDYFTASRPWTQKGDDVLIPIAGSAPVVTNNQSPILTDGTNSAYINTGAVNSGQDADVMKVSQYLTYGTSLKFGAQSGLEADLSAAAALKANEFREAFALQRYKEARAKYGSRYTEYLRYLGVRSSDARLQRPEYLGGGKSTIAVSEVLNTASDTGGTFSPLGSFGGHGITAMRSRTYQKFFEEHGYVISLMSIRPKTIYVDGVLRTFLKETKEDFWQKELQSIGQQEVKKAEVFADVGTAANVFGYADRYNEYKRQWSTVAGEFRNVLDHWHLGRKFSGGGPALNQTFTDCDATKRVFAEQTQHSVYVMAMHKLRARRMVKRGSGSSIS